MEEGKQASASSSDILIQKADDDATTQIHTSLPSSQESGGLHVKEDANVGTKVLLYEAGPVEGGKEAAEEASFDGEFIKVEKESIKIKENSDVQLVPAAIHSAVERDIRGHNFSEMQERINTLERELEKMNTDIRCSDVEKFELQKECTSMKERMEERVNYSVELELKHSQLIGRLEVAEQQIQQNEQMYNAQLKALEEALRSQDQLKNEFVKTKGMADLLNSQLEFSTNRNQELEEEVKSLRRESKKALDLHNKLESANTNVKEKENQISFLQEEINALYGRTMDNEKAEDTLKNTLQELSAVQDELRVSRSHALDLEQTIVAAEKLNAELKEQLSFARASEDTLKQDILALENLFGLNKGELQAKIDEVGDLDLKLTNERAKVVILEDSLKNQEALVLALHEKINTMTKSIVDTDELLSQLQQSRDLITELEHRLEQSVDKSAESDSRLEKALLYINELEKKVELALHDAKNKDIKFKEHLELVTNERETFSSKAFKHSEDLEASLAKVSSLELLLTEANAKELELHEKIGTMTKSIVDTDELLSQLQQSRDLITELEHRLEQSVDKSAESDSRLEKGLLYINELEKKVELALHDAKDKDIDFKEHLELVTNERETFSSKAFKLSEDLEASLAKVSSLELLLTEANAKELELHEKIGTMTKSIVDTDELLSQLQQSRDLITELEDRLEQSVDKSAESDSRLEKALLYINELEKKVELALHDAKDKDIKFKEHLELVTNERETFSSKAFKLSEDLEASLAKVSSLELQLTEANAKELELHEKIGTMTKSIVDTDELLSQLQQSRDLITELEDRLEQSVDKSAESHSRLEKALLYNNELEKKVELALHDAKDKDIKLKEHLELVINERETLSSRAFKLSEDLEASLAKVSSLELLLTEANTKEFDLKESLSLITVERNDYHDKLEKLENDLIQSSSRILELQRDLELLTEKYSEIEGHANMHQQRSLELEDLIHVSHSKAIDAEAQRESSALRASNLEHALHDAHEKLINLKEHLESVITERDDFECKHRQLEYDLNESSKRRVEMEQYIQDLTEKCEKYEDLANRNHERCLELDGLFQHSQAEADAAKAECEICNDKILKLQQDMEVYLQRISSFENKIHEADEKERELMENLDHSLAEQRKSEENIKQLEQESNHLASRNFQLEQELKSVTVKCEEHEGRANLIHQRSIQLEDLIQVSHSRVGDTEKKIGELELLLEGSQTNQVYLEEQLESAKSEIKHHIDKSDELSSKLEVALLKASTMEEAFINAKETVEGLEKNLYLITEEKQKFEATSNEYSGKLSQMENLLDILERELRLSQEKLATVEKDLENAVQKEAEILAKLRLSEEKLDQQRLMIEESSAKCLELELCCRDTNTSLQGAIENFEQRDLEAKALLNQVTFLEKEALDYKAQATEASLGNKMRQTEIEEHVAKLISLEAICGELRGKLVECKEKVNMSTSENEILVETNMNLKKELEGYHSKVCELENLIHVLQTEKEGMGKEIDIHKNSINELTDRHARVLELQDAAESRTVDTERKLEEVIEKFKLRDIDAKQLNDHFLLLESKLRLSEEKTAECETKFETENKALIEINDKLTQDLAAYQAQLSELQVTLSTVEAENVEVVQQFHLCKKTLDELTEQHKAETLQLESQISSIVGENCSLNERYENERKELEEMRASLEVTIDEGKEREVALHADIQDLRTEVYEKHTLLSRVTELERDLASSEARVKEQEEKMHLVKSEELEGLKAKLNQASELEAKIEDLENELMLARSKPDRQAREIVEKDLVETSTPSKRSKKKSSSTLTQTVEGSSLMGFKLILAVSLISLLVGVLLGRRD